MVFNCVVRSAREQLSDLSPFVTEFLLRLEYNSLIFGSPSVRGWESSVDNIIQRVMQVVGQGRKEKLGKYRLTLRISERTLTAPY